MKTRMVYRSELEKLTNDVIKMGSLIELQINDMITALNKIDVERAKEIIARDDSIDLMEHDIEKECIVLIAKQQPIASDLRRVTSIMKIITDIERIADHCSDISEYIIKLSSEKRRNLPAHLIEMVLAMKKMVADTIDSFVYEDLKKAKSVGEADDGVDELFERIRLEIEEEIRAVSYTHLDVYKRQLQHRKELPWKKQKRF